MDGCRFNPLCSQSWRGAILLMRFSYSHQDCFNLDLSDSGEERDHWDHCAAWQPSWAPPLTVGNTYLASACSILESEVPSSLAHGKLHRLQVCVQASIHSQSLPFSMFLSVHLCGEPSGMLMAHLAFLWDPHRTNCHTKTSLDWSDPAENCTQILCRLTPGRRCR